MTRENGNPLGSLLGNMLADIAVATKLSEPDAVLLDAVRGRVLPSIWMLTILASWRGGS